MADVIIRTVPPQEDNVRLDIFLAQQPEIGSRARAKELIDAGFVSVAGLRVRPGLFLDAGQEVAFEVVAVPPRDPLADDGTPPPPVRVLFADPWLVAIDKPAGLAAHPPEDRNFRGHTVASIARTMFGAMPAFSGEDRPGIVHRLDKDTTGVMVLARTEEAFHFLQAQFRARTAQKEYRCIAYGDSRFESDWVERPIAHDPRHPDRMTVVKDGGREASTFYEVVERFAGFTYFRCRPKTGRTHQIRVHMTSVGHSLVGDRVYRSRRAQHDELPREAPDPGRQCLHALRLQLPHPHTHELLDFEAPMPDDMQKLLHWLRENRPFRRA